MDRSRRMAQTMPRHTARAATSQSSMGALVEQLKRAPRHRIEG